MLFFFIILLAHASAHVAKELRSETFPSSMFPSLSLCFHSAARRLGLRRTVYGWAALLTCVMSLTDHLRYDVMLHTRRRRQNTLPTIRTMTLCEHSGDWLGGPLKWALRCNTQLVCWSSVHACRISVINSPGEFFFSTGGGGGGIFSMPSFHFRQKEIHFKLLLNYYPGQKKRPLRLCIKSEHCSYHGISKNQAWLRFGVQRCAKSRPVVPLCQSPDHADIAW